MPTTEDVVNEIKQRGLLKGHRWYMYQFIAQHTQASLRDIQKYMITRNCFVMDVVNDLVEWGVITEIGKALHPETGGAVPVYRVTNNLPKIPHLINYKDLM